MSRTGVFFLAVVISMTHVSYAQTFFPTRSVSDFVEVKKLRSAGESNFAARKRLFGDRFPDAGAFTGTAEQNVRLLKQLLLEDKNSVGLMRRALIESWPIEENASSDKPAAIQVLVGGFGWGSRSSSPPDIWKLNADKSVTGEPNLVAALLDKEIPADWDQVPLIVEEVKKRVQENKHRPVVLIGHSFGASAIVQVAEKLLDENIAVDLAIAIDAINSRNPVGILSNELGFPTSVATVVHIGAGDEHWLLDVANIESAVADYHVKDTNHTTVDQATETYDIIQHLLKQLPKQGINTFGPISSADYKPVEPPQKLADFPASLTNKWQGKVFLVPPTP